MSGNGEINPWTRADLETFNVETLELVPPGLQEDYTRIMKQLAHAKGIAALALEQVHLAETERHAFFDWLINTKAPETEALVVGAEVNDRPNNTIDTLTPLGRQILDELGHE